MADTTVKCFTSAMTGAPTLNGTPGAQIALLDACLINGFGAGAVDSLVVSGGVATVTRAAGHPFEAGSVALLAGATVTGGSVNGEQRVLSVTATGYTFAAAGIPNQTASGSITHKLAPLGWAKTYSGTNQAAYSRTDVTATAHVLAVDDTAAKYALLRGYEAMSAVATGTNPFPSVAQATSGIYWAKSATADSTSRPWMLVGNGRRFVLYVQHNSTSWGTTTSFGDFISRKSPDAYACVLQGGNTDYSTSGSSSSFDIGYCQVGALSLAYAPRNWAGLSGSTQMAVQVSLPCGSYSGLSGNGSWSFPAQADNGLYVAPMSVAEGASVNIYRGDLPGLYWCPQYMGTAFYPAMSSVVGINALPGRTLRALVNSAGPMFVDMTGPW